MTAQGRLDVRGLSVRFTTGGPGRGSRHVAAVSDASFTLRAGECLALVGESGCGKSVLAATLLGLLPANARTRGEARLRRASSSDRECTGEAGGVHPRGRDEVELLSAPEPLLARIRGRQIGLVPQSPASHLTPVLTVRHQLEETVRVVGDGRSGTTAVALAERAGFPAERLDHFPHQLSGGEAQRAVFALALVGEPWLLLADEPTSGLDRPLAQHVVDELGRLRDAGHAVLLITHDLAAAERVADRIAVMYAGRLVEIAPARWFFAVGKHGPTSHGPDAGPAGPAHPYARDLLAALPQRGFTPIPGMSPELTDLPEGCAYRPRCRMADEACAELPRLRSAFHRTHTVHEVACHHA